MRHFCTPYDVKGGVALTSQSGGTGMAILGFARTTKTGVSAIVGLGNTSDLDEDDLLTWFGEDPHTECIAMHLEDLKDGRAFVEAARATVPKKPVVVLKAARTAAGAKARTPARWRATAPCTTTSSGRPASSGRRV